MALFVKCFPWGALVRLSASFTGPEPDPDTGLPVPVDPDTVIVMVMLPDESVVTKTYLTDVELIRDSEGNYHYDVDAADPGEWKYRWEGTGAGQAAAEATFKVATSPFDVGSP